MALEDVMGHEKLSMSAKFIMKEDFFSDTLSKINDMFLNEQSENSFVEHWFNQLKSPIPVNSPHKGEKGGFVIDFIVKKCFFSI